MHITDDEFLKLLHEVGTVMHLWLMLYILISTVQLSLDCHVLSLVTTSYLSEIKDILPKSVKTGKVTQWLTERHETRPLMLS